MPPIWQPPDRETLRLWLDAIEQEASDSLTSWESDFVASLRRQFDEKRTLSQKQCDTLERIYAEKTT